MKKTVLLLISLTFAISLHAQSPTSDKPKRSVTMHLIHGDSLNLSLNENFNRIEDSCATLIRYSRVNPKEKKFVGKFKDRSQQDTAIVLTEGEYTAEGLKTGLFTAYHFNGQLQSKGVYKNNKYDGNWEVYYDTGKPHVLFEASNDSVKIMNVWDANGKQEVINGKGTYLINVRPFTWEGKLANGRPDGTWHAYRTTDATKTSMVDEYFKNGIFVNGNAADGKYTDASRITLINPDETFPYTRAEKFLIATNPCNIAPRKHIVNAQYENGRSTFTLFLNNAINPYLKQFNLRRLSGQLIMQGDILEDGLIVALHQVNNFDDAFVRGLAYQFNNLPALNPATIDGKPVRQTFRITFNFVGGHVHYTYRFLPVDLRDVR